MQYLSVFDLAWTVHEIFILRGTQEIVYRYVFGVLGGDLIDISMCAFRLNQLSLCSLLLWYDIFFLALVIVPFCAWNLTGTNDVFFV